MVEKENHDKIFTNQALVDSTEEISDIFRQNLVAFITDNKMTIKEVSDLSGVPIATINSLLYGRTTKPMLSTVVKLAKGLELSIDELVGISSDDIKELKKGIDLPKNKLAIVKWVINYLLDTKDTSNSVHVMLPNVDSSGNISITYQLKEFSFPNCEKWKINRCYMGILVPSDCLMPYYAPNTVLLIAQDRKPMHNERVVVRMRNYLYVCVAKITKGSTDYHHLNDEEIAINRALISEVMGYVVGDLQV